MLAGIVGFFVGLLLVWWIKPTTVGGTVTLIIIPIVFSTTVGGIVAALLGKKSQNQSTSNSDDLC